MPDHSHHPTFGEHLRWHRKAAGFTQAALANAAHVSERTISDLERGINQTPNKGTLDLLIQALGLEAEARSEFAAAGLSRSSGNANPPLAPLAPLAAPMPHVDTVLHQLQPVVADFVDRTDAVERLIHDLAPAAPHSAQAVVAGIRGMGGVGKTVLAHVVAHNLKADYPDAQLVLNLRGTTGAPLTPENALLAVMHAFQPELAPGDPGSLQASYLSLLSDKRVLILADDARDAEQVRALTPPPGSALLLTSRTHMRLPGMSVLDLDVLPPLAANAFLLAICERIGPAAARLADLCGYLPLALRTAASLLAEEPNRAVDQYLQDLTVESSRLARLRHPDDPTLDVGASLALSWTALDPPAQTVLAQLSAFPAAFDAEAAHSVVAAGGPDKADLGARLGQLIRRSLLDYNGASELYGLHDLVRVFAAARLDDVAPVRWRHAQHYTGIAQAAQALYKQGGGHVLAALRLLDREQAHIDAVWDWLRSQAESDPQRSDSLLVALATATTFVGEVRASTGHEYRARLEAALEAARKQGDGDATGQLLTALAEIWRNQGAWEEARTCLEQAVATATQPATRARELTDLGTVHRLQGDFATARTYHEESLTLYTNLDDSLGRARTLNNLGLVAWKQGDLGIAHAHYEASLALYRALDDRVGLARTLNNLGILAWEQGDYAHARTRFEESLALNQELGARLEIANLLGNLGILAADQGDHAGAHSYYEQSLALSVELGDRSGIAASLSSLGLVALEQKDLSMARSYIERGMLINRELDDRLQLASDLHNLALVDLAQGEREQARIHEHEALTLCLDLGALTIAAYLLVSAAAVLAPAELAACLLGASTSLGEINQIQFSPAEQRLYDQTLTLTQAVLGAEKFAEAFEAGQALEGVAALDEAIRALAPTL